MLPPAHYLILLTRGPAVAAGEVERAQLREIRAYPTTPERDAARTALAAERYVNDHSLVWRVHLPAEVHLGTVPLSPGEIPSYPWYTRRPGDIWRPAP